MPIIDAKYCIDLLSKGDSESSERPSQENDNINRAYAKIIRLVGVRDRSVKELRDRLLRDNFDEVSIEAALQRSLDCGLLDDIRFGEILISSRKNAGKGKQGIEYELEKHGIDASSIPDWPERYFPSEEGELEEALSILRRKPPTAKNKRDAAYRKLISKGYSSMIASRAARTWFEELT